MHTAEQMLTEVRLRVEDLALRMVLEEMPAAMAGTETLRALAATLSDLGRQADAAGRPEAAAVAGDLAGRLSGETVPGDLEGVLSSGIAALQELLALQSDTGTGTPAPYSASLAQDPELVNDFLVESREHLATVENQLLSLERNPSDPEALHAIFRGFHTIKGLAGFLEFETIRTVAHEVETVLDLARNGQLAITPPVVDCVLAGADYLTHSLANVEAEQRGRQAELLPPPDALLARVRSLYAPAGEPVPAAEPVDVPVSADEPPQTEVEAPAVSLKAEECALPTVVPDIELAAVALPPEVRANSAPETPVGVRSSPPAVAAPATANRANRTSDSDSNAVRVDTRKLDYLVDMVGEMVIAQSLVRHDPDLEGQTNPRLQRNLSQLARITGEVQKTAMAMRMLPVRHLFQRMARVVRDLSRKSGKTVELVTAGDETELDRTIVEELTDPLMHMIRNSMDHGIETTDERQAVGKNPVARVGLSAGHEAGSIVVQVSDDGRGLDRARIFNKAVERGLVDAGAHLPDSEIYNLIFEPGFSTAEKVTDVSGRGVGMDVVRRHIQKLRGRVHIESTPGRGTSFHLKLPLTLAIIDGLVVKVGGERYILPIFTVREMVRPAPGTVYTVHGRSEMALIRESLLPVVRLHRRFNVTPRSEEPCESLLVVAESNGKRFCLMVDELVGKQEVVIKSLGELFKNIPGVSGGAILGDGHVGLILDPDGVYSEREHA